MRTFLVVGHTQPVDPAKILLNDLPGASGRWDLLARCVTAALLTSHGVRKDSEIVLMLNRGPRYVRIEGASVRSLNPDERSTAALMAKALAARPVGTHEETPHPGLHVGAGDFSATLARLGAGRPIVWLDEHAPVKDAPWPADAVYVLSDHEDFNETEKAALRAQAARPRGLGADVLQADQAIVIAHDRIGNANRPAG